MKTCSTCKETKDYSLFGKHKYQKDGYRCNCKKCTNLQSLKYRQKNPQKTKETDKKNRIKYKDKIRQRNFEKYHSNREENIARVRKWQIENKERKSSAYKKWAQNNYESLSIKKKKWNQENSKRANDNKKKSNKKLPENVLARNSKRRASKLRATPKWLTKEHFKEIREIYKTCKEIQWLSEEKLVVDHISPLVGRDRHGNHISCGLHVPWNLQIISASQNSSKNSKVEGWEYL